MLVIRINNIKGHSEFSQKVIASFHLLSEFHESEIRKFLVFSDVALKTLSIIGQYIHMIKSIF